MPLVPLLEKTLGESLGLLHSERIAPDVLVLTPSLVSGSAMTSAVCTPSGWTEGELTVVADCAQMLDLMKLAGHSVVPADALAELRLAANEVTLTDHDNGAAAEVLYRFVRSAEKTK